MKWILCGKNDAAVACLDFLVERGDEVWGIGVAGDDGTDGWQRSFRAATARFGVRFDQPKRINDPEFVHRLSAFQARALVSIQYDQILRGNLFQSIGCPCLNLHFALLPRHRGVAPIAWAVVAGDAQAGVTLHHMIEDIDAGDLIVQRALPIEADDTAREVYDKVSQATVDLFRDSYPFPEALLSTRLTQDSSVASYHRNGDFDFSQRRIDWKRPALELQRWIRAMIFPPMQYPEVFVHRRALAVSRVAGALGDAAHAPPGTVIARSPQGLDVVATDRSICIREMLDPSAPASGAERIMESIRVGDRLT